MFRMWWYRWIPVLFVVSMLMGFAGVALAQDVPPTEPPVFDVPALGGVMAALVAALVAGLAGAMSSPLTAPVVNFLKWVAKQIGWKWLEEQPGSWWNMIVAVLLCAIVWVADFLGLRPQVDNVYKLLYALLTYIAPLLMGNVIANQRVYQYAVTRSLPVWGYQRTDPRLPPGEAGSEKLDTAERNKYRGQGLVEYALILVLVAVVVIVILAVLGPAIGNIFSNLVKTL